MCQTIFYKVIQWIVVSSKLVSETFCFRFLLPIHDLPCLHVLEDNLTHLVWGSFNVNGDPAGRGCWFSPRCQRKVAGKRDRRWASLPCPGPSSHGGLQGLPGNHIMKGWTLYKMVNPLWRREYHYRKSDTFYKGVNPLWMGDFPYEGVNPLWRSILFMKGSVTFSRGKPYMTERIIYI